MADRVTVAEAAAILGVSEDVVRKRLQLRGAQALLRHTETELAATREEAQFLRERLTAQEAIIAQLAEAQSEAQRRRDVLEAQGRAALPDGRKRRWWPWSR